MIAMWILTLVAAGFAAMTALGGVVSAKSAPQEAAVAAIALCIAVIPYVFTRALDGIAATTWRKEMLAAAKRASEAPSIAEKAPPA
ncbi:MAG: hypothetical protein NTV97_33680 [Alphaproteobacteria bacterium]|nr:hypothetical protein [Alphaproteobacteria bacterium]